MNEVIEVKDKPTVQKEEKQNSFKSNEVFLSLGSKFNQQFNDIFGKGKPDDNSSE